MLLLTMTIPRHHNCQYVKAERRVLITILIVFGKTYGALCIRITNIVGTSQHERIQGLSTIWSYIDVFEAEGGGSEVLLGALM